MFPIFLWVKEYNGLKDFKINLDSNYSIKFKTNMDEIKNGEQLKILNLKIEKLKSKTSDDFYGDNIDSVNLILGKNGSGKSSILDVLSIVNIHEKQIEHMIIYKTEEEDKYILEGYHSMHEDENYFSFLKNKSKDPIRSDYSFLIDSNNKFIRFLNFNFKDGISLPHSLIGKFKGNSKKRSEQEKGIDQYYPTNKDLRIARLNLNFEEDYYSNLYSYIFSLKENYSKNYGNVEMYLRIIDRFNDQIDEKVKTMLEKIGEKKEKLVLYDLNDKDLDLKNEILKNYCNGLYLYNFKKNIVEIKSKEDFNRINEEEMKKYKKIEIKKSLKLLLNDCDSIGTRDDYIYDSLVSFVGIIDDLTIVNYSIKNEKEDFWNEEFWSMENFIENYKFSMKFKFDFNEYRDKVKEYLKIYDNDFFKETYGELGNTFRVSLNGFSDGEKSLLGLFSSLYKVIEIEGRDRKYITLVFDEVENFLHPEWCRTLVDRMITELGKKYLNKTFKLIFATHSPFLLSDVLSENCIFLDKEENKTKIKEVEIKSFGANIHELLKQGMFMESTFGEFSRNKIKKIVKKIQVKNDRLEENEIEKINFVIDSIGEPLVADKLRKMLKKKIDNDNGNKMERYKKKIEELELEVKRLNKNIEISYN